MVARNGKPPPVPRRRAFPPVWTAPLEFVPLLGAAIAAVTVGSSVGLLYARGRVPPGLLPPVSLSTYDAPSAALMGVGLGVAGCVSGRGLWGWAEWG